MMSLLTELNLDQKVEFAMGKAFVFKAKSDRLYPCRKCKKTPVAEQEMHCVNLGDDTNKIFKVCVDKSCVEAQVREHLDPNKPKEQSQEKKYYRRTVTEKTIECQAMSEVIFTDAKKRVKEVFGATLENIQATGDFSKITQAAIFIESWARTLSVAFEGK